MELIDKFNNICNLNGDRLAIKTVDNSFSYRELFLYSNNFSSFLVEKLADDNSPIVVYGNNQNVEILPVFFSCLKSSHPYLPIDDSTPLERCNEIIREVSPSLIIDLSSGNFKYKNSLYLTKDEFYNISSSYSDGKFNNLDIDFSKIAYVIYTSGSSGVPKGVKISYNSLHTFVEWLNREFIISNSINGKVILNPALISFDFYLFSMLISVFSNSTLLSIDRKIMKSQGELLRFLQKFKLNIWVSTPSLLKMILFNEEFNEKNLPLVDSFIIGGERFSKRICEKCFKKFKKRNIFNVYGPTETTIVVSKIKIDNEMISSDETIPVGDGNSSCIIDIVGDKGKLKAGETGEIILTGDVIAEGYIGNRENSDTSFFYDKIKCRKTYKTGDLGYIKKNRLYFVGRKDKQVKLHGYRIELEDIENNMKKLNYIDDVVVVPAIVDEEVKFLLSVIILNSDKKNIKSELKIKKDLSYLLPEYMIPKVIKFVKEFPLNKNMKIDKVKIMENFYDSLR